MENLKQFLDNNEILLNADKIKPTSLLDILNSIHLVIQFTMEVRENNYLLFHFNSQR